MTPTIEYIEKKFEEYNHLMFGGRLPKLPIVLSDAKTFLGQCVARTTTLPNGLKKYSDFELRINTRVDYPEEVVEDTIIHEMIHYFIFYHNLHDTSAHGDIFISIMQSINANYGRKLSISHHASKTEAEQAVSTKRTWHVVAIITFQNGKVGVKVLPRVQQKIIYFCQQINGERSIKSYSLYMTDEPFFNRFPTSVALKINYVDKDEVLSHLSKAQELIISNNQVINKP
jgi:predicted SprT family Zn-dependent metalloprotease